MGLGWRGWSGGGGVPFLPIPRLVGRPVRGAAVDRRGGTAGRAHGQGSFLGCSAGSELFSPVAWGRGSGGVIRASDAVVAAAWRTGPACRLSGRVTELDPIQLVSEAGVRDAALDGAGSAGPREGAGSMTWESRNTW